MEWNTRQSTEKHAKEMLIWQYIHMLYVKKFQGFVIRTNHCFSFFGK